MRRTEQRRTISSGWLITVGAAMAAGGSGLALPAFEERVVSSLEGQPLECVRAADLDGDGDTDILGAGLFSQGVVWFENSGGASPSFERRFIPSSEPAVGATAIECADLDGDGDLDVIAGLRDSGAGLAWFEQVAGAGPGEPLSFIERLIPDIQQTFSVGVADLDGDGDLDLVSAGVFHPSDVAWFENDGASPPSFIRRVIPCTLDGGMRATCTDLDSDGDADVLITVDAFTGSGWLVWLENDGQASPSFTERVIANAPGGESSAVGVDLDRDGDTDVLAASRFSHAVSWQENIGGSPPAFVRRALTNALFGPMEAVAVDLDGEGDLDVLVAGFDDQSLAWLQARPSPGAGPWAARTFEQDASSVQHVVAADIDGDGDADPVSAFGLTVSWYENLGACFGDADGDRVVNFGDLNAVLSAFGQAGAPGLAGDLNGDGIVGFADLNEVLSFFGIAC